LAAAVPLAARGGRERESHTKHAVAFLEVVGDDGTQWGLNRFKGLY